MLSSIFVEDNVRWFEWVWFLNIFCMVCVLIILFVGLKLNRYMFVKYFCFYIFLGVVRGIRVLNIFVMFDWKFM